MKFSVLIPLYNKQACVGLTLQSVLAQTFTDFEILVVDDGSTDDGSKVVEFIARNDGRIRLIQQKNAGVSAARNLGISEAKGEWIAFLDADDWWHPNHLRILERAINSYSTADMVSTALRRVPDASVWSPLPWPEINENATIELIEDLPMRWALGIPFFTSSVAVRRSLLANMQPCFPVGENQGEDLDLWFRIGERTTIAHTPVALVAYRTDIAGSLTSQHAVRVLAPFLLRMQRRALSGEMPHIQRRSALKLVVHQKITLAREALISGSRFEGVRRLWEARQAWATPRWCLTVFMALVMPSFIIRRWDHWRNFRTEAK
ncbi:hypothetical protein J2X19_001551 [Rhodoferax ferrireducens]|uniref:Glycosyltransferase 2-like domain-containing protein n=1 Tax=Rhodoferax ferrireducens TaxID=192843 RepID=A0ABU2C6E6_9BURK|nr:glycosyltransferase family A protein [Rhodoferax ferrireducens]MDR7376893.1 hypothetical protein [Rhodoferax ferrireducens]